MEANRKRAAAEWRTGTETFVKTDATTAASFSEQAVCQSDQLSYPFDSGKGESMDHDEGFLLTSHRGKRMPLKKAAGLYKAFFSASYRWTLSFPPFILRSSRHRSSSTPSRYTLTSEGLRLETKILVHAKVA